MWYLKICYENINNMDKQGFFLDQALKAKVICCKAHKNSYYSQDGYCKMVTVTECVFTDGSVIPSIFIYKRTIHLTLCRHASIISQPMTPPVQQ
jgi:hypothetical protein